MKEKYPMRHANFVDGWMDMTPRLPVPRIDWISHKHLDVAYGTDEKQRLDLYLPAPHDAAFPLVILVHGGGFCAMDKRDWHLYPGFFALERGFALASINYRLAPKHKLAAIQNDTKEAMLFLRKSSEKYGLDAKNFFLMGTSAGGNLVSKAALDGADSPAGRVNAVAALCGLFHFEEFLAQLPATKLKPFHRVAPYFLRKLFFGCKRADFSAALTDYSADGCIPASAPPFFIQHGDADRDVPVQQSIHFYQRLQAATGYGDKDLVLDILQGAGHAGSDVHFFQPENITRILDFFEAHLASD